MIKIILSIQELDEAFEKLIKDLTPYSLIEVTDLENYDLTDCDIFIGKKLNPKSLVKANKLKIIFAYKTGVDDFPLVELAKRNITLINSHADSDIIAEYAFGLAVTLVNRISEFDLNLREGIWYDNTNLYWKSIFKMKVGLYGYGHIGKAIHRILAKNDIATYTINRGHIYEGIQLVSNLEELIETCDLIIASVPKTKETDNVFNEKTFSLLTGKYLVNVGRSNVIDQKALYESLVNNLLGGVAIDTWDAKPKNKQTTLMPSKYPFEKNKKIILSPHAAMRVSDGHNRYVCDVTNMVIDYLENNTLTNVIDLKKGY